MLALSISYEDSTEHYVFRRTLLSHIDELNAQGIDANIAKRFAKVFYEAGQWKDAKGMEFQVMEARKRVLGEEHPETLSAMVKLALTYRSVGLWKEVEKLEIQVMEARKRTLGEEHPETLSAIGNLASTYQSLGQWKDTEKLEIQVMEARKRV
jgi:Tetratricopeptide repeat